MTDMSAVREQIADAARRHFARSGRTADVAAQRAAWRGVAELGWIAATVPETCGGYGGPAEMAVLAREFALAASDLPFLEAGVVPAAFFAALAASDESAAAWLDRVTTGETIVVVTTGGNGDRLRLSGSGDSVAIDGRVAAVIGGALAGHILIDAIDETSRRVVALVDVDAPGMRLASVETIDGREACILECDSFHPTILFASPEAGEAFDAARDRGVIGQCAELVALAERMLDLTREHLLTRHQFGRPLASFQALRHRVADMFAELVMAQAILETGIAACAAMTPARARTVSACKLKIGQMARFVGGQAIQLHGGMGMTEDYALGRLYKRSLILRKLWGDEDAHAARMMRLPREGS